MSREQRRQTSSLRPIDRYRRTYRIAHHRQRLRRQRSFRFRRRRTMSVEHRSEDGENMIELSTNRRML